MKIPGFLILLSILLLHGNQELKAGSLHSGKVSYRIISENHTHHTLNLNLNEQRITIPQRGYAIQLGAFKDYQNAEKLKSSIEEVLPWMFETKNLEIIIEDDFYKVRLFTFKNREEVNEALTVLASHKIIDYQLVWLRADEQQVLLKEGQDSVNTSVEKTGRASRRNLIPAIFQDTLAVQDQSLVREIIDRILYSLYGDSVKIPYQRNEEIMFPGFRSMISGDTIPGSEGIFDVYNPWLKRFEYFGKSITLVAFLIAIIILSIGTMVVLLVVILLNRRRMERREKLNQYLLEAYQQLIISYLYGEADLEMFRGIASNRYRRKVLIDQMKDVAVNLKGDSWEKLRSLYLELGLDYDSVSRANARRWHIKIKGFRELAFMNIKDANDEIYRCLNSHNEILRMEAQIALVRLSDDKPFEFLYHLKRPFSQWEQITLHELIVQHSIEVPLFSQWIDSPNDTVVMFALRMIREFRQNETEDDVRRALGHPNKDVRELAIKVAGDLKMKSTLGVMKRMYKNEDYNNSLEILRSMGKMPDEAYLGFLKLVLDKEDDVQLQIEATKAIENMGEPGIKELVKLMKSEYKNYNIIIRHVLDRRIY
ncbi:MAG: SPOR domain-containing protein [Bacteroidales bacterium]|nr:SPOR domain-containing protein [Bacteroidales bacterium]